MATFSEVREGYRARLETIGGLRAFATWPNTVLPPGAPGALALVKLAAGAYEEVFGATRVVLYKAEITVLVQLGTLERAQDALDAYLAPTGARSIVAAILGDSTLGGVVERVQVHGFRDYDTLQVGGEGPEYLGAVVDSEAWAL